MSFDAMQDNIGAVIYFQATADLGSSAADSCRKLCSGCARDFVAIVLY